MAFTDTTQFNYLYTDVKDYIAQAVTSELQQSNYGNGAIRIFKSDPLDEQSLPAIGINMVNLDEDSSGIGLTTQPPTFDQESGLYTTYQGAYMKEIVEVRVFHTNADERDKLRIFTLAVLFAVKNDLLQMGIQNITLSGGRDEQDNTLLQSGPLFMNSINLSYLNPLDVTVTTSATVVASVNSDPQVAQNGTPKG